MRSAFTLCKAAIIPSGCLALVLVFFAGRPAKLVPANARQSSPLARTLRMKDTPQSTVSFEDSA
jgi:hypothetical protein